MNYFITGVAGTGKSTLIKALKKKGYLGLDIDLRPELRYWVNKKTGKKAHYKKGRGADWINAHSYVVDVKRLAGILKKNKKKTFFVCGITSNQSDAFYLFEKIFLLKTTKKVIAERLIRRKGNSFGKEKSERAQIFSWYKGFEKGMRAQGAIAINAAHPTHTIVKSILKKIL